MQIFELFGKRKCSGCRGFSLVELLVVIVIVGVLAVALLVSIKSVESELKTFVFSTKAKFQMARFESIKRSLNVYIDFDVDDDDSVDGNRYTVWADADNSGPPYVLWDAGNDTNVSGECDAGDVGDCLIETEVFQPAKINGPEIYNPAACSEGPPDTGGGVGGEDIGDGVAVAEKRFLFSPNGDAAGGSLYIYFPEGSGATKKVIGGPWAVVVSATGRIRVDRWGHLRPEDWDGDQ